LPSSRTQRMTHTLGTQRFQYVRIPIHTKWNLICFNTHAHVHIHTWESGRLPSSRTQRMTHTQCIRTQRFQYIWILLHTKWNHIHFNTHTHTHTHLREWEITVKQNTTYDTHYENTEILIYMNPHTRQLKSHIPIRMKSHIPIHMKSHIPMHMKYAFWINIYFNVYG